MDAREVVNLIRDQQIKVVDLRFCDLPGLWQHFTIAAGGLDEDSFTDGFGFDGSSIRGFQQIQESDMILIPDPSTCFEDPFSKVRTLILICNIADPITQEPYSRDPRYITQKAEKYLVSTGIADTAYFGPEPEFFVLDDVRFDQSYNHGYYYIDSVEGFWNSGARRKPQPGLQASIQGRLLPRSSHGHASGYEDGDDAGSPRRRHRGGSPSPRSGNGRPMRDRHALRFPGQHGR